MKRKTIFICILSLFLLVGSVTAAERSGDDPPLITHLEATGVTPFSAVVTWQTDLPADSRVEFWTTDPAPVQSVSQPVLTMTHRLLLTGLSGASTYHYRVTSETGAGQVATSTEQSFTTPFNRIMLSADGSFLVDGEPFFPIMQWLQCGFRIGYQTTLGINTFMGMGCGSDTAQAYLDTCQANDVWGILKFDAEVQAHPHLLGWFWEDEPEMPRSGSGGQPLLYPDELRAIYETIRAQDQAHPFLTTFTSRFAARFGGYPWMDDHTGVYSNYIEATDVPGFDHYPVYGWCRPDWLHEISDFQDEFMEYAKWRPTYQWIEAARTSGNYCNLPERGEDDGPYPGEIRNEVWQAIVHGVKAIGYFTHSWECPGYSQFCVSPEQEAELIRTNRQITALTPAILGLERRQLVTGQETGGGRVDFTAREYDNALYIFAVNLEREAETAAFTIAGFNAATVEVIDEERTLDLTDGRFEDEFAGLEVHLYRIPYAPLLPDLTLRAVPANSAIHLTWDIDTTLPATTTWHIDYYTQTASIYTVTETLSTTRSTVLTDHVHNYQWYTVTLHAMLGDISWLNTTARVMPTDRLVYLPLVLRGR